MKVAIEKPALYQAKDGTSYHLASFDHSFPSGHAMRAVLVAGVVLYVWRRVGLVAAAWALIVPVCLVAASWHVPSDVAGGVLFGLPRGASRRTRRSRRCRARRAWWTRPTSPRCSSGSRPASSAIRCRCSPTSPGSRSSCRRPSCAQARRRALLVLAAGGDPHRELDVDAPAVKSLAADLFDEARRAQLAAAIDELVVAARDLPRTREAALFLAADVDLAWRLLALGAGRRGARRRCLRPRDSGTGLRLPIRA